MDSKRQMRQPTASNNNENRTRTGRNEGIRQHYSTGCPHHKVVQATGCAIVGHGIQIQFAMQRKRCKSKTKPTKKRNKNENENRNQKTKEPSSLSLPSPCLEYQMNVNEMQIAKAEQGVGCTIRDTPTLSPVKAIVLVAAHITNLNKI